VVVIRHRLTLVTATIAGLAVLLVTASVHGSATVRQVAPAGAVTLVFLLLAGARLLPGRRLLPYWGRAAEILESLCAVLLVPLVLGVLHVYSAARGING
jgi:Kef-type K+ transport system membrane component KefB